MKRITTILAIMLITGSAFAQSDIIIKEKAKAIRDQNNQQQGVAPAPGTSPTPGAPAPGSAPQGMSPAQQALVDRFQNDLGVFKGGATVTDAQKLHLQDDITLLAKGANKPSKQSLTKLSEHLATALNEKPLAPTYMTQLARNINIVANCGSLTSAQAQKFVSDTQLFLKNSGVSAASVDLVGKDLNAIIVEVQKNKPKLYQ